MRREHVHRRTRHTAILDRIRVHRDEQIRLCRSSAPTALPQRHEVVAASGQHRLHAGLGVDASGERARDRESHVFLVSAIATARTGVLTTMTGVNGDDEIARWWLRPG